jgi:hypothetical protein
MKDAKKATAEPVDTQAVESLLADPAAVAQASVGVASAAIEAALAKRLPIPLWALAKHPAREVGKAARRALHLLRSRGVDVGEQPAAAPAARTNAPGPEEATEPCRTTAVDGFGDRALWIPLKRVQGFDLWELILSDELGIREVHRVELSRKQLRGHFESLPKGGMGAYVVARSRAAGLLAEALALGGGPRESSEARELLGRLGAEGSSQVAPVLAEAPVGSPAEEAQRLSESAALFDEPELRTFVPPETLLRELAVKLDEIEVSPLLLDERQKSDRRQNVLDQAVESYFTPERRARYARRLLERSDLWAAEDRADLAGRAAAVARHLAGSGAILENPFARRMFQRIFSRLPEVEKPEPEKPAASALIVPG